MMRVLHLNAGNLYGGVETFLVTLAREAHHTPDMVSSFGACFEGRYTRELEAFGVDVVRLGAVRLRRPDLVLRARRRLTGLLRRRIVDIVVCHQAWVYAVFGVAARRVGVPVVLWLHTVSSRRHWLEHLVGWWPPSLVVANSRYTAAAAAVVFARSPVEWVHCPLTEAMHDSGAGRLALRVSCSTAADDVVIVQVGRLERLKGNHLSIEALSHLRDQPGWMCWVVGGPQRAADEQVLEDLRTQARRAGIEDRVRFLGERIDVSSVLQAADIYCQPNVAPESLGLSLVEALAAGLPVVSSAIGGAPEIVDESCGVLLPPGDVGALTSALNALITNPDGRARLGLGASQRAAVLCDPARQMQRIQTILSMAVGHSPAAEASGS